MKTEADMPKMPEAGSTPTPGAEALLSLTNPGNIDPSTMPPLSMRALLLLEQVNSPFMRQGPVKVEDGSPVLDKKTGMPVHEPVVPTMQEIVETFFVLVNQDRPNILQVIKSDDFPNIILEFGAKLTMDALGTFTGELNKRMADLNSASGGDGGSEKKATGSSSQ